LPNLRE